MRVSPSSSSVAGFSTFSLVPEVLGYNFAYNAPMHATKSGKPKSLLWWAKPLKVARVGWRCGVTVAMVIKWRPTYPKMVQSVLVDLFWLWRFGNDGKCYFLFLVAFIPTKETFTTDVSIRKKLLFSQENVACALISRKFLMPLRACPKVWSMIKTSLWKQTSCSDLEWARAHLEWRGDA